MKTVYELPEAAIKLEQSESAKGLFRLTYFKRVQEGLTYSEACEHLGQVILHHLSCEGVVNSDGL